MFPFQFPPLDLNLFNDMHRSFSTTYQCYSVAMLPGHERKDVEGGGKIIMPSSALEQLTRLNINYPMLFKLTNKKTNRETHCGVLEFIADEGKVYLPLWMMHNLVLQEGDRIGVESISLPVGTFSKFQPLNPDFLDITNPKAVLENCLRSFACLTVSDVIAVPYNEKIYELCVLETKPGNAISIIECDMNVDFAAPVGYTEPHTVGSSGGGPSVDYDEEMAIDPADLMPEPAGFVAFRGAGNRLDGKQRRKDSTSSTSGAGSSSGGGTETSLVGVASGNNGNVGKPTYVRGIPDHDYVMGTLRFFRHRERSSASTSKDGNDDDKDFRAFSGNGFSLSGKTL